MQITQIDHTGTQWWSLNQMLEHYGISMAEYNRRKQRGLTLEEILSSPDRKVVDKLGIRDHKGNVYKSWAEVSRACGVPVNVIAQRVRLGWDVQRIMETPVMPRGHIEGAVRNRADEGRLSGYIDHTGRKFDSLLDMCKYWDISVETYRTRMSYGWDIGRILTDRIGLPEQVWSNGGQFREEPQPEYIPKKVERPRIEDGHEETKLLQALWDSESKLSRQETPEEKERASKLKLRAEDRGPAIPTPPCDLKPKATGIKKTVVKGTGKWSYSSEKPEVAVNKIDGYVEIIDEDGKVERTDPGESEEFEPLTPMVESTDSLEKREIGAVKRNEFASTRYSKIERDIDERIKQEQLGGFDGQLEQLADAIGLDRGWRQSALKPGTARYNKLAAARLECLNGAEELLEQVVDLLSKGRAVLKAFSGRMSARIGIRTGSIEAAYKHLAKVVVIEALLEDCISLNETLKSRVKLCKKRIEQSIGVEFDDDLDETTETLDDALELAYKIRADLSNRRSGIKSKLISCKVIEDTQVKSHGRIFQYVVTKDWDTKEFRTGLQKEREKLEATIEKMADSEKALIREELLLDEDSTEKKRKYQDGTGDTAIVEANASRDKVMREWRETRDRIMKQVLAETRASKKERSEQRFKADQEEAQVRRQQLNEAIRKREESQEKQPEQTEQAEAPKEASVQRETEPKKPEDKPKKPEGKPKKSKKASEQELTEQEFMEVFGSLGIQLETGGKNQEVIEDEPEGRSIDNEDKLKAQASGCDSIGDTETSLDETRPGNWDSGLTEERLLLNLLNYQEWLEEDGVAV